MENSLEYYTISKLWLNPGEEADRSTWLNPNVGPGYAGPHMNPNTKTGQMCIMMAIDARVNHGILRSKEIMIRFITELAVKVGMAYPEKRAKSYFKSWLNEGLIKKVGRK